MAKYPEPVALRAPRASIEEMADRVRQACAFATGGSLLALIDRLGGKVDYCSQENWAAHDGSLDVHAPANFEIRLSAWTSEDRDRFTIAHELGHYFLHSRSGQIAISANRFGSTPTEWEANWFAAALLMPSAEFKDTFQGCHGDFPCLAAHFRVSLSAAKVRASTLKLH